MWTVIYITSSTDEKNKIEGHLETEGFMVQIRQTKSSAQYEILVLENEVEEVREELNNIIH